MNPAQVPPYLVAYGASKIVQAQAGFNALVSEFGGANVIAQITAAGKTKLISDAVRDVMYYGTIGSLWECYASVERIQITPEMAPFLNEERKQHFKNRLIELLSSL